MLPGLLGALTASLCYGSATVLQALGVRRMTSCPPGSPLLERAWAGRLYAVGLALDGVGFLASLVALRSLPLFVVQSAIASSVAVTAVLAVAVLHARLSRAEVAALAVVGLGLVALGVSAGVESPAPLASPWTWLILAGALPVALLALVGWRLPRASRWACPLLAAASGLGFGGVGVAARVLAVPDPWWHLLADPLAWAIAAYGLLAMACYGLALDRGSATTTAAVTFGVETVVPAAVGLLWLGDTVRSGFAGWAALGFVATLGGCLALARRAEVPGDAVSAPRPASG
ncbi:MAG TPA: hypothetical protein VFK66_07815 [Oryzihumus sp.]|nr:hypothetical protein [Oryzihumus sp.]